MRLEPVGAPLLDVEIARSSEGAFRSAGGFGLSPMVEVDDFQQVPAARRDPFERLVVWVAAHSADVVLGEGALPDSVEGVAERAHTPAGSTWLLIVAVSFALASRIGAKRTSREDKLAALILFVLALVLRVALGPWGPLRINGLGAMWIMAVAVDPGEIAAYGPGYAEVFAPFVRHLPFAADSVVFGVNATISSLVPVLGFALARLFGIDARRALLASLVLALDPVSIRIAATESYVPLIVALATGAAAAAAASSNALGTGKGWRRAACLAIAAALLCAQCVRIHPAAWLPVAMAPLAAGVVEGLAPGRRLGFTVLALALCGAFVMLSSGSILLHAYESMHSGDTMTATWTWPDTSTLARATCGCALLLVVARPRGPLVLGALSLLLLASTRHNYDQSALWQASFDRLYFVPMVVGAVTLVPRSLTLSPWFVPAASGVLVVLFAWRAPRVLRGRTTDHEEYLWARRALATLPRGSHLVYVAFAGKRNLFLPTYAMASPIAEGAIRRLDGREPIDTLLSFGSIKETYYAHTSLCSSVEGRPICDEVERQLVLEPVAHEDFVPVPSNDWLPYDRALVSSVISRVAGYARPDAPPD